MVRAAIALLSIAIAAPGLAGHGQELPAPEAGVSLFWASNYTGDNSSFRERVVAAGEDWAIYESLWDTPYDDGVEPGPGDYFAMFNGIDYRSCSEDEMPSEAERAGLSALRPFEEGTELVLTSLDASPSIRVGAAVDFFLMGKTVQGREVVLDFADDAEDKTDEALTVLENDPYTVKLDWGEDGIDRVMLIAQSDTPVETPTAEMLGNCASLLN